MDFKALDFGGRPGSGRLWRGVRGHVSWHIGERSDAVFGRLCIEASEGANMLKKFQDFAIKGNAFDLAVGVIMARRSAAS